VEAVRAGAKMGDANNEKLNCVCDFGLVCRFCNFLSFSSLPTNMNLPSLFLSACDELGGESYVRECLVRHFADVCCDGDVVLQEILASTMTPAAIEIIVCRKDDLAHSAIDILSRLLQHWRKERKCTVDVWWAC
jgi:hypothetical protein